MPPRRGHRTLPDLSIGSEKKHSCRFCGHRDQNKDDIEAHERSRHTGERLQCGKPRCNFHAWSKADLRRHDKKEHQGLIYECPWCQQAQNPRSDNLRKRHMSQCPRREGRDPKTAKLHRVAAEGSTSRTSSFSSSAATHHSGDSSNNNNNNISNSDSPNELSPNEGSLELWTNSPSQFESALDYQPGFEYEQVQFLLQQQAANQNAAFIQHPEYANVGEMQQEQQDLQMERIFDFNAASSDSFPSAPAELPTILPAADQYDLSEYLLPQMGSWQLDEDTTQQLWLSMFEDILGENIIT